jgi:hypothetical protein
LDFLALLATFSQSRSHHGGYNCVVRSDGRLVHVVYSHENNLLALFPDAFEDFVERWDNAGFVEVELTSLGRKILRDGTWPWKGFLAFNIGKFV